MSLPESTTPVRGTLAPSRPSATSHVQPATRDSRAPVAARHPVVQAIDHAAELAFVILAGVGWILGKTTFEFFAGASFIVMGVQNGIRTAGGRGALPPVSGAVGLAVVALGGAYLRTRGIALLGVLGALGMFALAVAIGACGGTGPAMRTSPVLGYYSSPDWGKCVVGGARVESVGTVTVTAHGCVRVDGADAGGAPIAGFTALGGTHDPFASGGGANVLAPIAITADAGARE